MDCGIPLNTSLAMVSTSHMQYLIPSCRSSVLGCSTTIQQNGWLLSLTKSQIAEKKRLLALPSQWASRLSHLNVNTSGKVWEISDDGKTLIQPLTSIKGLGSSAMDQILEHRPFQYN